MLIGGATDGKIGKQNWKDPQLEVRKYGTGTPPLTRFFGPGKKTALKENRVIGGVF